jgi:hypothetical protein
MPFYPTSLRSKYLFTIDNQRSSFKFQRAKIALLLQLLGCGLNEGPRNSSSIPSEANSGTIKWYQGFYLRGLSVGTLTCLLTTSIAEAKKTRSYTHTHYAYALMACRRTIYVYFTAQQIPSTLDYSVEGSLSLSLSLVCRNIWTQSALF